MAGAARIDDKNCRKKVPLGHAEAAHRVAATEGAYLHEGRALKVGKDPADRARDFHELGPPERGSNGAASIVAPA
ncbi:MAG: hypothetical protein U1F17_15745 [Burkholderiaceae bacterium]